VSRTPKDATLDLFGSPTGAPASAPDSGASAAVGPSPLADRMRPRSLDEVVGQEKALAPGGFLREAVQSDRVPSMILWGPPGCGKTSLAHVIAQQTRAVFEVFSAVLGGLKEVRELVGLAQLRHPKGVRTILFVDEIHRFNKSQQDAFLPHVERGTITLIGATTENPSFALNAALLSRCRVVTLEPLDVAPTETLLRRALADVDCGLGGLELGATDEFLRRLAERADGDARRALNLLEQAAAHAREHALTELSADLVEVVTAITPLRYDRAGDAHYDTISAFIKSMRGSDPDAALYYAARMLEAGEDPRFVLRRVLIFASEDVGNADPQALQVALAAVQAYERLGMPEAVLPLAQAVTYCACAPKSNAAYKGWLAAVEDVRAHGSLEVPKHIRNAPTRLMAALGHGAGYQYPHDHEGGHVREQYLPEALRGRRYYRPTNRGAEAALAERLRRWWGESDEG
jgi:putative ATPase